MNNVQGVGTATAVSVPEKSKTVNFRAQTTPAQNDSVDSFIKEQEKARKKAERDKKISMGISIGTFAAFLAIAAVSIASITGKFNPAGFKKSQMEFKSLVSDSTLGDLKTTKTLQDDVKTMLVDMINSKEIKPEYLELAGLKNKGFPNAAILTGASGTGKTESIKMFAKADGSDFAVIKMTTFGNSYLNGNAVSMSEMFKEISKMLEKNPNKKFTILFDEGDALTRKIQNIDSHNEHLGKDRQSFITGLEELLRHKNVNVFMATNVPIQEIDEAVITRFGRNINYNLPNAEQLFEGLKFHLRDVKGCNLNGANFFDDKKEDIMAFIQEMIDKKCAFRDLKNVTTQAMADYSKEMQVLDKQLPFDVKYLSGALKLQGKTAGEIASESAAKSNSLIEFLTEFLGKGE